MPRTRQKLALFRHDCLRPHLVTPQRLFLIRKIALTGTLPTCPRTVCIAQFTHGSVQTGARSAARAHSRSSTACLAKSSTIRRSTARASLGAGHESGPLGALQDTYWLSSSDQTHFCFSFRQHIDPRPLQPLARRSRQESPTIRWPAWTPPAPRGSPAPADRGRIPRIFSLDDHLLGQQPGLMAFCATTALPSGVRGPGGLLGVDPIGDGLGFGSHENPSKSAVRADGQAGRDPDAVAAPVQRGAHELVQAGMIGLSIRYRATRRSRRAVRDLAMQRIRGR